MSSEDDDDDGSYGFEYSDEDMSTGAVDIENEYYKAKGDVEAGKTAQALEGFKKVVDMEENKGEWGFKAYKQIVKLQCKTGDVEAMLASYRQMLTYAAGAVAKNTAEKKINSLLGFMSNSKESGMLERFYEATLASDEGKGNERLWFKTSLKLCDLWFSLGRYAPLAQKLSDLERSCTLADGSVDLKKATLLLEVLALSLQVCAAQRQFKKLKELYSKALAIRSAIPHPRVMGTIRENGGKMHMRERAWEAAHTDFFEAFKAFDDAGSPMRVQCLKYLVLASMLMESHVDPFNAQETQPYREDPQIKAMTALVEAYQQGNIGAFERVLRANQTSIAEDPFIKPYLDDLMTALRTQVVLGKVVGPYTRVRLSFVANKVNCSVAEAEHLVAGLICDGRVSGEIDQVNEVLLLKPKGPPEALDEAGDAPMTDLRPAALTKWVSTLGALQRTLLARGAQ